MEYNCWVVENYKSNSQGSYSNGGLGFIVSLIVLIIGEKTYKSFWK